MSTNARPQGGPGSVFLIDGSNFIFRAFHGLPTTLTSPGGVVINAVHGFVRMIQALRKEFKPEVVIAVFDHSERTFRSELYPEYKAHRPPMPEDLVPQLPLVRGATAALGIPVIEVPGVEADDVIACYALHAQKLGRSVVIVSTDKDLMQLIDAGDGRPSILLWDSMKDKLLGPAEVVEKWGVPPSKLTDLLALTGDTSDNVPGVPGIGPKTAAQLLEEFGSLEGVLQGAASIKQAKRREVLQQHAESARLSRKLVELRCDLPLPRPLDELADHGPDPATMESFFAPLGFRSLLGGMRAARAAERPPEGPLELRPGSPLTLDKSRYLALTGESELVAWADAVLARASLLAVQIVVDVADSMRAALVGVALAPAGEGVPPPAYLPLAHTGDALLSRHVPRDSAIAQLRRLLGGALPLSLTGAKFQAIVLARHGVSPGPIRMDPKLASYTLDPARTSHSLADLARDLFSYTCAVQEDVLGKGRRALTFPGVAIDRATVYACERAELALRVGQHLRPQIDESAALRSLFDELEIPLVRVLQRIEERGIRIDPAVLARQGEAMGAEIAALRVRIAEESGQPDINPDSPQQVQKLLFEDLGLEASRKTKTGFSTDAAVLEELAAYHPVVGLILEYRGLTKLKGTYLDTLPHEINAVTGRLHTNFRQAVAQTGRLSSKDPNLQNIPIRTEVGRRIREAFVAGPGKVLVTLDYSQIELRILAHLSGDKNLVSAFQEGVDVHRRTAAEVFGVAEKDVTSELRRVAKAVNFGVIYGQTAFGLARQLGIPRGKAGSYIKAYFDKIPGVTRYMDELVDIASQRGYAETVFGRRRRIPELARKGAARSYGERIARNTPIQGSAADIMKRAMIAVDGALGAVAWAQMLLTVHDELIFECDAGREVELVALARPLMEGAAGDKLSVPLVVESGSGPSWAACKT